MYDLNNIINQFDITGIFRAFHSAADEYVFFVGDSAKLEHT